MFMLSFKLWKILKFPGDYGGEVTPVPIPNTVVKLSRADGTAGVTLWESRSLPGINEITPEVNSLGGYVYVRVTAPLS